MTSSRKVLVVVLLCLALVVTVFVVLALQGAVDFLNGQDEIQSSFGD